MFLTLLTYKDKRFHQINLTSYLSHVHTVDVMLKLIHIGTRLNLAQLCEDQNILMLLAGQPCLTVTWPLSRSFYKHLTFTSGVKLCFHFDAQHIKT
jgi:hypothetical protein